MFLFETNARDSAYQSGGVVYMHRLAAKARGVGGEARHTGGWQWKSQQFEPMEKVV